MGIEMPTDADVLAGARRVCRDDARGVRVIDVIGTNGKKMVNISFPKPVGMSDTTWQAIIEDVRAKLLGVPGVDRVGLDLTS
jgi:hypothetical protein